MVPAIGTLITISYNIHYETFQAYQCSATHISIIPQLNGFTSSEKRQSLALDSSGGYLGSS